MSLNLDAVGTSTTPDLVTWDSSEALLYALGVGAGQADASAELAYTTENSEGHPQRVLPTFGVILAGFRAGDEIDYGSYDPAMLVHAEQRLEVFGEIPPSGRISVSRTLEGIYDKGSGALVVTSTTGRVPGASEPLIRTRSSSFIRGEGGFGVLGPHQEWVRPDREPDERLPVQVRHDQALLYRLSGDRNPLHTDPVFAARAGFPRPILHGLCTYGIVGRLLLDKFAGSEPARFRSLECRFTAPVYPGDNLSLDIWAKSDGYQFVARRSAGKIVLDRGLFVLADIDGKGKSE
ncbi:MaoC/PaaZ C-terminal domain-containing protein [Nocardia africana]|uniref:MaoC/PaaZ C-terminal domain-containing protein n=1 Tax=Nocardia africana TaxID=134964 RepID=A0ABW6NU03_9NOCA